jgi:transposase
MQVLYSRCAGLDVHKRSVTVCILTFDESAGRKSTIRKFGTMTSDLEELGEWLKEMQVTHAVMESTGVYWRPVYEVLEESVNLILVNAQHVHALPGRKTDTADAEWLAELLGHGLVKASFVPPRWQRELRELTRFRRNLVQRRAQVVNELQKTLETANIKLAGVVSDITGVSATEMLQHLVAGSTAPELLSDLARGALRKKKEALCRALNGRIRDHHRLILGQQLAEISALEEDIEVISAEIQKRTADQAELIARLDAIPGINRRVAEIIIAEMGTDTEVFGNKPERAMAWAGICPGNNQSGGKRGPAGVRSGNRNLTTAAVEAALAAIRSKSYFASLYRRVTSRRGHKRAVLAVGHAILKTAFVMMMKGTTYEDLGLDYFDKRRLTSVVNKLKRRLDSLGFEVELRPKTVAA